MFVAIAMMVSEIQFLATMPKNVRGRWFSTLNIVCSVGEVMMVLLVK